MPTTPMTPSEKMVWSAAFAAALDTNVFDFRRAVNRAANAVRQLRNARAAMLDERSADPGVTDMLAQMSVPMIPPGEFGY